MNKEKFLAELQDILQCDDVLSEDTILADREEWDSLSIMTLIAFFDKELGQRIKFDALKACRQVRDIIALSKGTIG